MKSATNFQKILYQRVLLDNSDGFEPPRLHQKRNPLIKPMDGFFLILCGFCGCKTYHYGAWVFNRFQLFFNAICHESATTILPGSAKSKNRAKKEQGCPCPCGYQYFATASAMISPNDFPVLALISLSLAFVAADIIIVVRSSGSPKALMYSSPSRCSSAHF